MNTKIIEIAAITLVNGKTEKDLVEASNRFQSFLSTQPGFIARSLVSTSNGQFADIIEWKDRACADAIMHVAASSPECHAYFCVMNMEGMDPSTGVAHYSVLAQYRP